MLTEKLQECMRIAGYSPRTIKTYALVESSLCRNFQKPLNEIGEEEFTQFLDRLAQQRKSPFTLNQYHAVLKLIVTKIYKQPWNYTFPYAKRHNKLPVVLSRDQILQIIGSIKNSKHRTMIALAYGAGLRVSEVLNVRIYDLDLDGLTLRVNEGKGGKDRITIIPAILRDDLRALTYGKDGHSWIFESERGGKLATRTAQQIFERALSKAQINQNATFHSLRHSFATHLLENGVDSHYIQKLLGHSNIATTMIYAKVTNPALTKIRSPL
jgi:site-specific recombinase XerD